VQEALPLTCSSVCVFMQEHVKVQWCIRVCRDFSCRAGHRKVARKSCSRLFDGPLPCPFWYTVKSATVSKDHAIQINDTAKSSIRKWWNIIGSRLRL